MRGRPRKPTLTLIQEGKQVRGRDPDKEPRPAGGIGTPPDWFTPKQRAAWRRLIATVPPGVLTSCEHEVAVRWSVLSVRWVELEVDIRNEGLTVWGTNGEKVRNPKTFLQSSAAAELDRLGSALGLSPAARTRISIEPGQAKSQDPEYRKLIGIA